MSVRIKTEPMDRDLHCDAPISMDVTGIGENQDINDENVDEDADDEIVREIDVYLSPALESQMYLLQFPLRHQSMDLPQAAKIKAKQGMLELEHALPQSLKSFQTQRHVSHNAPVSTHLLLGKFVKSASDSNTQTALHLIPLSRITQMRPSFEHIDELNAPPIVTDINAMEEEPDKAQKKPVMFQKKESERAQAARQNSYAYKKSLEDADEWQDLTVYGPATAKSQEIQMSIACSSLHSNKPLVTVQEEFKNAYIQSLNYLPDAGRHSSDGPSIDEGDLKQLYGKATNLMHLGWPVPYSVLRSHFSSAVDDVDLLMALSSCSVLVRGNFVLLSKLTPLPPPIAQARTFLLYILQTFGYIQRFRLDHVYKGDATGVSSEVLLMILQQVAEKCTNGWKLKLEDNITFLALFPDQAQLHSQYWERKGIEFASQIQLYQEATFNK